MQSEEHIRRLVRELDLPDQADQVIQRPKYWTVAFCRLFLEKCDELIFDDAQAGLRVAEVAPELASLVARFSREKRSIAPLRVRARAVLGSAQRATGDLEQAEATYWEAVRITRKEKIPAAETANLLFRISVLKSVQNRLEESLSFAEKSVEIYRRSSREVRQRHLGEALIIRGYSHVLAGEIASAMKDWSEALSCTDPKKKPRVYLCASHNLACGLVAYTIDPRSLSVIERCLRQARKCLSKRPRSLPKLRLIWLEGMIMIRFGSTRRGEAALKTARQGFIDLQAPYDMALVSLVLGRYLKQNHQPIELKALAIETQQWFSVICSDKQTNRALYLWKEAVLAKTLSSENFDAAWRTVQRRAMASARRPAAGLG